MRFIHQVSSAGDTRSFLPGGYNDGWLCFEATGAKRRLIKYPPRWREFDEAQLTVLLQQAQPAPKGSMRIYDDLGDAPNSNARPE